MTLPRQSSQAFSAPAAVGAIALLALVSFEACGAGSSLDDYSDGVPEIVPEPITSVPEDGGRDAGVDAGSDAGRDAGGGNAGGAAGGAGGAAGGGGASQVGGKCTTPADCAGDGSSCLTDFSLLGILSVSFPQGYCSKAMCQSDAQCPSGSGCETTSQICLRKCTRSSDCRASETYTCAAVPLVGTATTYCLPPDITNLIGGGQAAGLGGLLGGAGGTQGGFIAGLGGLLGGGGAAGGTL